MPSASCETTACGTPDLNLSDLREESEESVSEAEIEPIRMKKSTITIPESENDSEPGTIVGSEAQITKGVDNHWHEAQALATDSENSRDSDDPEEMERQHHQEVVAQMLKDLRDGKTPHDASEETSTDRALVFEG
jgi:hypothetical protein